MRAWSDLQSTERSGPQEGPRGVPEAGGGVRTTGTSLLQPLNADNSQLRVAGGGL